MTSRQSTDERLRRAYDYPYAAPQQDFLFSAGAARPLAATFDLRDRQPVIAVGSNRAPEQLARKFGDGIGTEIPVTWARMHGFDVVYSAHLAGYGSVPATLHPSPGTAVRVAVTWLTADQLARMHETEQVGRNYVYGTFEAGLLDLGAGRPELPAGCYITKLGALALDGAPVALAEVEAAARRYAALPQPAKIALLHRHFGGGEDIETWLLSLIGPENAARRDRLVARLAERAERFADPRFTVREG